MKALYVMIGISLVLVAVSAWSVDGSRDATARAEQTAHDLALLQERQTTTRAQQIAACERSNAVRRKLNGYALTARALGEEFARWLGTSAEFRDSQGEDVGAEQSRAAKRRVEGLAELLSPIGETDCEAVIP